MKEVLDLSGFIHQLEFKVLIDSEVVDFTFKVPRGTLLIQILDELRTTRNERLVKEKLAELKKVAQSTKNIMPTMIETVKTYATIQEICDVLREVFGEYQSPQIF